jgi:nitrogen regulatory protein PII
MSDGFDTAKVKLVTIIASFQLGDRIATQLRALGVSGYTKTKADGWGQHGTRQYGIVDSANVRIESLVRPELARQILQAVVANFANLAIVAFTQDVEAVPTDHFEAGPSRS